MIPHEWESYLLRVESVLLNFESSLWEYTHNAIVLTSSTDLLISVLIFSWILDEMLRKYILYFIIFAERLPSDVGVQILMVCINRLS